MKRSLAVLLALIAVPMTYSEPVRPDIGFDVSSSLAFGIDLNENPNGQPTVGFKNDNSLNIWINFFYAEKKATAKKADPTGYLSIEDIYFATSTNTGGEFTVRPGVVTAMLLFEPYYIKIDNRPRNLLNLAPAVISGDDVMIALTTTRQVYGFTYGFNTDFWDFDFELFSNGDFNSKQTGGQYTGNIDNEFGGVILSTLKYDPFRLKFGGAYGMKNGDIGFGVRPHLYFDLFKGIEIYAAMDYMQAEGYGSELDLATGVEWALTKYQFYPFASASKLEAFIHFANGEMAASFLIKEGEDDYDKGIFKDAGGQLQLTASSLLSGQPSWSVEASGSRNFSGLEPFGNLSLTDAMKLGLGAGIRLREAFHRMPNLVFSVEYSSVNLNRNADGAVLDKGIAQMRMEIKL
jgi:hypothetical protein